MEIDPQSYLFSQYWRRGALGLGSPVSGDKRGIGNGISRNLVNVLKGVACVLGCPVVSDSLLLHGLQPTMLLCPWDFPGNNTGVGCHSLLQGIFLT